MVQHGSCGDELISSVHQSSVMNVQIHRGQRTECVTFSLKMYDDCEKIAQLDTMEVVFHYRWYPIPHPITKSYTWTQFLGSHRFVYS